MMQVTFGFSFDFKLYLTVSRVAGGFEVVELGDCVVGATVVVLGFGSSVVVVMIVGFVIPEVAFVECVVEF
jgi:hypothetical protein